MRKLARPHEPEKFTAGVADFYAENQTRTYATAGKKWQAFRDEQPMAYKAACDCLHANQQGLCAYCEADLKENNRQIEHVIPKSCADADWTLNFANYLLCCLGGTKTYAGEEDEYLPGAKNDGNISCGSKKGEKDPRNGLITPHTLPRTPVLKSFPHPDNGVCLSADEDACSNMGIDPHVVNATIEALGLNCARLRLSRQKVWNIMRDEFTKLANSTSPSELDDLRRELSREFLEPVAGKLPQYITTRILHLEEYLPQLELIDMARL